MDKEELCRALRCADMAQDKSAVDTLMLRFRPIAPKPTNGSPCVGDKSSFCTVKRRKRKYVRVSMNNKITCGRKGRSGASDPANGRDIAGGIVTLQLLPEKSDGEDKSSPLSSDNLDLTTETIIGSKPQDTNTWFVLPEGSSADPEAGIRRLRQVETWLEMESITGACYGGSSSHALGCTDVEIVNTLDKDTCPGFISDGSNRVMWVNEAYRMAVSGEGAGGELPEVVVWLGTDGTAAFMEHGNFTCRVRMQYTWQETRYTKTVPCDVWKMEFGGFAWRLDTEAALTLWL